MLETSQNVKYPDSDDLRNFLNTLSLKPPLVASWEIEQLLKLLEESSQNKRFILHAGACAERFDEANPDTIARLLKIILQVSINIQETSGMPVTRIARLAGQYAKPRSKILETINGVTLLSWRGDLINGEKFEKKSRTPNPQRLLDGHANAAITLNFMRALIDSGFTDLKDRKNWALSEKISALFNPKSKVDFITQQKKINLFNKEELGFFVSHESLHIPYEKALTRKVPRRTGSWNLSTHFPWIGARTSSPHGPHVDFSASIQNPIGIKIPPMPLEKIPFHIEKLKKALNPNNTRGRLTFIHRFGLTKIEQALPVLLKAIKETCPETTLVCDPMHGNTLTKSNGWKERKFEVICKELGSAFSIHNEHGMPLNGISIELTGDFVSECTGGKLAAKAGPQSRSACDPRLNPQQALELAFFVGQKLKDSPRL